MKAIKFSSVQLRAVLVSVAANAVMFTALGAGFGRAAAPELAVLELPAVTVVGKRLADESVEVRVAKTPATLTSANPIKL